MKKKIKKIKENSFFQSLFTFTFLFLIITLFAVYIYYRDGKTFILYGDNLNQHFVTLRYFRDLLINFVRTGNFSTFTWKIGLGYEMFSNFAYYIFGDFFSYMAVLFKTKDVEILANLLVFIRTYFAGVAFLCYAHYKKIRISPSVIGALMYSFCNFSLFSMSRHPFFINSMIIFPLLMIGIEKIILENKKIYFTLIVAFMYIVNFYYAFMFTIIIFIYGVILIIWRYWKEGIKKVLNIFFVTLGYAILGVLISSIILIPTGIQYINSERLDTSIYPYSLSYYRSLFSYLLNTGGGYWVRFGVQSIILITLPVFILHERKKNFPIFLLLIMLFISFLIPQFASIIVGFSFPINRYAFVVSFIFSFITAIVLSKDYNISKKEKIYILCFVAFFYLINIIFEVNLDIYVDAQIMFFLIILILMISKEKIINLFKKIKILNNHYKNSYNILLMLTFTISILVSLKIYFVNFNYTEGFVDMGTLNTAINTSYNKIPDFNKALKYIKEKDSSFYRITKSPFSYPNLPLLKDYNSSGHYYSISQANYNYLSIDLLNSQYYKSWGMEEFDYRTKITTLFGSKYLINYNDNEVFYGYNKLENYQGNSSIYENKYYLPFGVLYNSYITEEEYEKLSPLEKESSLLKTSVVENKNINNMKHFKNYNYSKNINELNYTIENNVNILNNHRIEINDDSSNCINLNIDKFDDSELYIYFENFDYIPYSKKDAINSELNEYSTKYEINSVKNKYKWYQPNYGYEMTINYNKINHGREIYDKYTDPNYIDSNDFLFNLGYFEKSPDDNIKIYLYGKGVYKFDNIKVYAVSMDGYEEDINNLRKSNFEATEWNNGYIKGKVNAETDGILQFQTFYNKGFKVYVDGKEVEILKSNKYFLGIKIDKGEHNIYIKYETPYLKLGAIISIISLGVFVTISIINYKKRKTS